jgi:hypothetical protein
MVGFTSDSLVCGPEGDWPRLDRVDIKVKPITIITSAAVKAKCVLKFFITETAFGLS